MASRGLLELADTNVKMGHMGMTKVLFVHLLIETIQTYIGIARSSHHQPASRTVEP